MNEQDDVPGTPSAVFARSLLGLCKRIVAVRTAAESSGPLLSCQGQAMGGYSELADYRNIAEACRRILYQHGEV